MDGVKDGSTLGNSDGSELGSTDGPVLGMILGIVDGLVLGIKVGVTDGITLTEGTSDTDGANDSRQHVLQQFAKTSGYVHLFSILSTAHAQSTVLLTSAT